MRRKRQKKSEAGFTLLEVIVAIAVLSLVLIALLPLFPQSSNWTNITTKNLQTSHLLTRVAQDVKENPAALSLSGVTASSPRTVNASATALPAYDFPVNLAITFDPAVGLHRVHIKITQQDGKGPVDSYVYVKAGGA